MSDDEFKNMLQDFNQHPGLAPTPAHINQNKMEKVKEKEEIKISDIIRKLDEVQSLIAKDIQEARIEYFTVDYLYSQIPKQLHTEELNQRIEQVSRRLKIAEHNAKSSQVDDLVNEHKKQNAQNEKPAIPYSFNDIQEEVGLDTTDETRVEENVVHDESEREEEESIVEELPHPVAVSQTKEDQEDLHNLQTLEKQERAASDDLKRKDAIDSITKTMDTLEEKEELQEEFIRNRKRVQPPHQAGTNLVFGKQLPRQLSATELYDNGMAYFNNKDYPNAIKAFKEALKRAPNNFAVRIRLSEALEKLGEMV